MLLYADRATLQQMLSLQKDLMSRLSSAGVKDTQGHPSAANSDLYRHICAELVSQLLDKLSSVDTTCLSVFSSHTRITIIWHNVWVAICLKIILFYKYILSHWNLFVIFYEFVTRKKRSKLGHHIYLGSRQFGI